jgi:hypothetical protein
MNLTAANARIISYTDLIVHNEIDYITRKIIAASASGESEIIINDGTPMTDSTPNIVVAGSVENPVLASGTNNVVIAGTTVTLGTDGSDLNSVIALINDAEITGVVASKNSLNQLVITYNPQMSSWNLVVGSGTSNADLGLIAETTTADMPESTVYYTVWGGTSENRKYARDMTTVAAYFQNNGFNIVQRQNTVTETTFIWELYW